MKYKPGQEVVTLKTLSMEYNTIDTNPIPYTLPKGSVLTIAPLVPWSTDTAHRIYDPNYPSDGGYYFIHDSNIIPNNKFFKKLYEID